MAPALSKLHKIAIIHGLILVRRRRRRRKYSMSCKRLWVRGWIERRELLGANSMLFNELLHEDPKAFKNFLRMDIVNFEYILEKVRPHIMKQDTVMRQAISPRDRLAVTLRYLATGNSFQDLQYTFRIPETTLSKMIPEVCDAIYAALKEEYLKTPSTEVEWLKVALNFWNIWNFLNCIGALDGKHINFRPLRRFGSLFHNYKKTDSIILLALVDACYKFLFVDVGANGRCGDSGVYNQCDLKTALVQNSLNIPPPTEVDICGEKCKIPHTIVADDAFALGSNIMKGYPLTGITYGERIFNYRMSRARRVVENAFGLLANRFQVLLSTIRLHDPKKVDSIVLACVVLHNFLITRSDKEYFPAGAVDQELPDGSVRPGAWRSDPTYQEDEQTAEANDDEDEQEDDQSSEHYKEVRTNLQKFFLFEHPLPWQWNIVKPTRLVNPQ